MAEVGSAYVSLVPSAKGFGRATEQQVGREMNTSGGAIGKKFGTAFKVGAAAVVGGAVVAGAFLKGSLDEAREAQKVAAQTTAVIKSTGGAAGITADQVGKMAGRLSAFTGIDDEAIQSGANLLLTFKNIKNEVDGKFTGTFDSATQTLVDMSAAMGTEPKAAAIQLGKALNDPIKGISTLSRVGATFTDGQKKVIESLVKGGKTAEAQKIILKELNSEFGGSAAAQATAGDKFGVAFGNLQESVGTALLPLIDSVLGSLTDLTVLLTNDVGPAFKKVQNFVAPFAASFGGGGGDGVGSQISSLIALVRANFLPVMTAIGVVLQTQVAPAVKSAGEYLSVQLLPAIMGVVNAFKYEFATILPIVQQAIAGMIARIQPFLPQIKQMLVQIVGTFRSSLELIAVIIRTGTDIFQALWQKFGQRFMDYLATTLKNTVTIVRGALNIIQGVIRLVTAIIKGDWSGAWSAIKQILKGAWQVIRGIVSQGINTLKFMLSNLGTVLKVIMSKAWDSAKQAVSAGIKGCVALAGKLPGLMVAAVRSGVVMMLGVGEDLIAGLVNGIRGAGHLVIEGIGSVVDAAIAWAKKKLHIGSPSKLFHQFGHWTAEGFANGLIAGTPGAAKAAGDLVRAVQAKVLDALTSMRDKVKTRLSGLKSDFISLRDSIAQAFTGGIFNVSATEAVIETLTSSATDGATNVWAAGAKAAATAASSVVTKPAQTAGQNFISGLTSSNGSLGALIQARKQLLKWGWTPQQLSQLFASGNTDLILELGGNKSLATQGASLLATNTSLANQLGTAVAKADIGPKIDATNKRLERIEKALHALPKHFGEEINKSAKAGKRKAGK